jgi:hypothetical protein
MSNPEEMDDLELFENAVTDEGGDENLGQQTEHHIEQQPEGQDSQQATSEDQPADKAKVDDNAPQVPSWRVREINEEKRRIAEENERMKAELAEFRRAQQQRQPERKEPEKANRPDPLLDPDGYAKQVREDIRSELLNERREESLQKAAEDHPDDFKAAYTLAQQRIDPALRARMQESRDPGKTLLTWYREQKTVQEVGSDPKAWFEKQLEERMKDPAFLAKAVELARGQAQPSSQHRNGRPRVELPPTLNGASRANAAAPSENDNASDRDLWNQIAG